VSESIFDKYELQARMLPAVLVLLPAIVLALHWRHDGITLELGTLVVVCGMALAYLGAKLIRALGRRIEPILFSRWGGMPSVQILRHRDTTFTAPQKLNFHAKLAAKAHCVMPNAAQETLDTRFADEQYLKASNWLRTNTRDPARFPTIAAESTEYGFFRNAYAVRWIGVAVAGGSLLCLLTPRAFHVQPTSLHAFIQTLAAMSSGERWIVAFDLLWAIIWFVIFRDRIVQSAAWRYARALVEASDSI